MSNKSQGKGVKLKPRQKQQEVEEDYSDVIPPPPQDIYESVVHDLGFDPLKERAARRT